MRIQSLRLRTFRNHDDTSVAFGGGINALIGRNGQGKTNILEAVSYLSLGKSFFAALDTQVVQHNAPYFDIRASFVSDSGRETEAQCCLRGAGRGEGCPHQRIAAREGLSDRRGISRGASLTRSRRHRGIGSGGAAEVSGHHALPDECAVSERPSGIPAHSPAEEPRAPRCAASGRHRCRRARARGPKRSWSMAAASSRNGWNASASCRSRS